MATMSNQQAESPAPNGAAYDPIMVVAASVEKGTPESDGASGEATSADLDLTKATVAIWQVETDPAVQRGDLSGAWVITPEGISGFAADAEWIEDRQNPTAMIRTLLRYPVLLAPGTPRQPFEELLGKEVLVIDSDATTAATQEEFEQAKKVFAKEFPGKRQPAWGEAPELTRFMEGVGEGSAGAEASQTQAPKSQAENSELHPAVRHALTTARSLREWLAEWNAFDKLRVRRLGQANPLHSEPTGAPLR